MQHSDRYALHLEPAARQAFGDRDGVTTPDESAAIVVEPMGNMPVLKDLIVDMDAVHWKKIQRVTPWLLPEGDPPEREYIVPPESMIDVTQSMACIQCGACVSSCLSMEADPDFIGPAALAKAYRFVGDPRDGEHEADRDREQWMPSSRAREEHDERGNRRCRLSDCDLELPRLVAECAEQWSLELEEPIDTIAVGEIQTAVDDFKESPEFARLGGLHRNTFLNSPRLLDAQLRLKSEIVAESPLDAVFIRIPLQAQLSRRRHVAGQGGGGHH